MISAHTFGMFAFSVISGRMTDRWGRGRVIIAGATVMFVAWSWPRRPSSSCR